MAGKETIKISEHYVATRHTNTDNVGRTSTTTYIHHHPPKGEGEPFGVMTVLFETNNPRWKEPDINFNTAPGRFSLTGAQEYLLAVQWAIEEAERSKEAGK